MNYFSKEYIVFEDFFFSLKLMGFAFAHLQPKQVTKKLYGIIFTVNSL